jgi:hypothetical protein
MISTIDGPAGTGKSTVAQAVAERLGFDFLDTGAMYRAIALQVLRSQVDPADRAAVEALATETEVSLDRQDDGRFEVLLEGEPVEPFIRAPEVGEIASTISIHPGVRRRLVAGPPLRAGPGRDRAPRPPGQHPGGFAAHPQRQLYLRGHLRPEHRPGGGGDGGDGSDPRQCGFLAYNSVTMSQSPAGLHFISDEEGNPTGVIVPIDLWREIASERETAYLLQSETMRRRLFEAAEREEGIPFDEVREKLGI